MKKIKKEKYDNEGNTLQDIETQEQSLDEYRIELDKDKHANLVTGLIVLACFIVAGLTIVIGIALSS